MNVTDAPSGVLNPKQPWYPGKVSEKTWVILKTRLTGGKAFGTEYSSFVNLTSADADRLIENLKKDPRGYPQVNQTGGAGGYENLQKYQEWLREEYLEKPFQQQTNQKIEDAAIESRLKEIQEERKQKATSFISGATSFRPGKKISSNVTKMQGIIPKRSIPSELAQKISSPVDTPNIQPKEEEDSSSFGRLLFNFVQINNDLEAIKEVIEEDFKTTKEKNKQEVDEYKKRVANRGRKLTKKELGSDKKSVTESIKPFISNFFSGAGGAIRSLALLKMLLGILNGDISSVFKGLFGIGLSFLPKIGMMIAGGILKNLLASMAGRAVGGGISRGVGGGMRKSPIAAPSAGFGKWAKIASLGTGALALGSAFSTSNQDQQQESVQQPETQKRLEELTLQQKSSPEVSSIAQEDLKKFQELNMRFEKALEFFIETYKKTMQDRGQQRPSSSGPGTSPGSALPLGSMSLMSGDAPPEMKALMDTISSPESGGNYEAMYPSTTLPGATEMTISEVARTATGPVGKYQHKPQFLEERARQVGLDPTTAKFNPQNQDLITRGHITSVLGGDEASIVEQLKRDPNAIKSRLEGTTYTGLQKYGSDYNELFKNRLRQYEGTSPVQPAPRPADGRRSSALSGSGSQPNLSVTVVPVSSNKQGAVAANSGTNLPSIDPNYSGDRFSLLTAGELNLVGALG
jgi:hypothetical protein